MNIHQFRTVLCALAALFAAAPAARAQNAAERAVTRAELQATGAANLYDAIVRTRPGWLLLAGDSADAAARARVLVFVDGDPAGTVDALRTLPVEGIGSVRVRSAEYVRRTMPRFPRQEFTAALFVATRTSAQQLASRGRTTVRVRGGVQMISQARRTGDAYDDAGFDDAPVDPNHSFSDQGTEIPVTLGVGVHYAVRPRVGVEAQVQHTLDGYLSGLDYARGVFNATLSSTEGAVLATYTAHPFRVGVGPGYRRTRWTYYEGFNQRIEGRDYSSGGLGVVASLSINLPARGRTFGEFTLQASHYPSEETPSFGPIPSVAAGNTALSATFGFGTGF